MLAVAEGDLLGFLDGDFLRREAGALVAAIAERLVGGSPAGTPPVIAGLEIEHRRLLVGNDRFGVVGFGHGRSISGKVKGGKVKGGC